MTTPAVRIRELRHDFAGPPAVAVLEGIGLEVLGGQFVSIIGPSGCGKSTILRVLAGLLQPSGGGECEVHGQLSIGQPGLVGYMPQRDTLLPWRRALANATLGAEISGRGKAAARAEAGALFRQFGLGGFERAWPSQLSGGMRQRVALLRTVLAGHDVLVLDEPFGALDALTRRELQAWLADLLEKHSRTAILVTHDVDEAIWLSDFVIVLSPRPASVRATIEVSEPRPRPARFLTDPSFVAHRAAVLAAL